MIAWFVLAVSLFMPALGAAAVLPVDQAFNYTVSYDSAGDVRVAWTAREGYYLYRDKFKFVSKSDGVTAGDPVFPTGEHKHDDFFGDMVIHRGQFDVRVPLIQSSPPAYPITLEIRYQGCSDAGICYPPQRRTVALGPSPAKPLGSGIPPKTVSGGLAGALEALGLKSGEAELLPPDEAFRLMAEARGPNAVKLAWQIADGYYLYREKFRAAADGPGVRVGSFDVPHGELRHDDEFGDVEVFHREVAFDVPVMRDDPGASSVRLQVFFQGCADRGVCYPPMEKVVSISLPAVLANAERTESARAGAEDGFVSAPRTAEHDQIARDLRDKPLGAVLLSFLGFGVLLAFTPCIFPMIPILSGIIVGHGAKITTRRAFSLSLAYVLASAAAYTVFGVLAGLFGSNLQAVFQTPWVIACFSAVFVLLALSMFGFFTLHLPVSVQSRIAALSSKQEHGTLLGAAIMGALSALVVGPCVAAPLAGALIYIGQTGDAWLGGAALFSLGFGMGIPLLMLGASAGTLLPKAGLWMNGVKAVFGVGLLGVAVWLIERIVPGPVAMFLWSLLLIIPAIYLHALDPLPAAASGWRRLWKGIGVVMLVYGMLMLLGVAANSEDPLQPLRGAFARSGQETKQSGAGFVTVRSLPELDARLAEARAAGRWVMLDYYADWCVSCKEMERYTFADPRVATALSDLTLVQADVTANGPAEQALLGRFGLVGPPATLFFGPDGSERAGHRIIGYMGPDEFLQHIREVAGRAR